MGTLVKKLGDIDRKLGKFEIIDLAITNAQTVIESSKYDLLKVYIELKRYEIYLKTIIKKIQDSAYRKAKQVQEKSLAPQQQSNINIPVKPAVFIYSDARVRMTHRVKWDFLKDDEWLKLDNEIRKLTSQKKERERYLIKFAKSETLADPDTGEIIETGDFPKEIRHGIAISL